MLHSHLPPNLLLILAYLLKTKSVSSTAVMLGMSQPSVSRSLARLRDALKDPLLVRAGNQMTLTYRAEGLAERLADWVATTSTLLEDSAFEPDRIDRRFRIASTDFGISAVCVPALAALRAAAPSLALDVVPLDHNPQRALASGEIDFAISGLDHDPELLHRRLLFEDGFVCVTRAGHPLGAEGRAQVSLDAFLGHAHLGLTVSDAQLDRVDKMLGEQARGRRVAMSVPYFSLAPEALLVGDLVMAVPSRAAAGLVQDGRFAVRPAPDELGTLRYWLLWHERSHRDPASAWLREQLGAACARPAASVIAE